MAAEDVRSDDTRSNERDDATSPDAHFEPEDLSVTATVIDFLRSGEIIGIEPVPWGSNYSFAVVVRHDDSERVAIYKPLRGEVPLWDFPDGTLYRREQASFLVSQALGWRFIPPTVIRDGPHGIGTVQLYIEPTRRSLSRGRRADYQEGLRRVALFDVIANNADRKPGHCFIGTDGRLWGIDHGLTFNVAPKLRTIIWDFCGDPIPDDLKADLIRLIESQNDMELGPQLRDLLDAREVDVFFGRAERLVRAGAFPALDPARNVPRGFW